MDAVRPPPGRGCFLVFFETALDVSKRLDAGGRVTVDFVSPVLSVMLSTRRIVTGTRVDVEFGEAALGYAKTNGLHGMVDGTEPDPQSGTLSEMEYTALVTLATHAEVNACNAKIEWAFPAESRPVAGFAAGDPVGERPWADLATGDPVGERPKPGSGGG